MPVFSTLDFITVNAFQRRWHQNIGCTRESVKCHLEDTKSSEIRAVNLLLARLEDAASSPAADKKEGFLQDPSVIYLLLNVRVRAWRMQ
jgi:hypothetical protein